MSFSEDNNDASFPLTGYDDDDNDDNDGVSGCITQFCHGNLYCHT